MTKMINLVGNTYNHLTVLEFAYCHATGHKYWKCRCNLCNRETIAEGGDLKSGHKKSCGCLRLTKKGSNNSRWKGIGEMSGRFFALLRQGSIRRNIEFAISREYAWNLFLTQNKKCALSGVELVFGIYARYKKTLQTASLDRIDNSKGYIEGNVQWVHKELNLMKLCHSQEEFIHWCKLVAEHHKE